MDTKDEKQTTADALRDSVTKGAERNVDDIIGEIIGGTGDYSSDYTDMFSKYNAEYAPDDNTGVFPRRDYSAEADAAVANQRAMEKRIARKMAPSVRGAVSMQTPEAVHPEFAYDGSVVYPSQGVGESGERVVFDADWEDQAKEEAAKRGKYYRDEPQRQPPPYANEFHFSRADEPREKKQPARADKPPRSARKIPAQPKKTPQPSFQPPIKDNTMDFKGIQQEPKPQMPRNFAPQPGQTANFPKPEKQPEPENRGLTPEKQRSVDNAVLEAFSSDFDSDELFKERWKDTVEKAQRRKEQKAKEAQETEAKLRSLQLLEEKQRKIAQMEANIAKNPPPAQKGAYTPAATYSTAAAAGAAEILKASPLAEKLDEATVRRMRAMSTAQEKTITKTRGEKFSFFMKTHFSKEGARKFFHKNLPNKDDSGKEKFRKVIMDISFLALICGLIYLAIYLNNYLARIREVRNGEQSMIDLSNIPDYELDEAWAKLRAKYPDVDFPEGMNIKFAELYATSKDVVGWLHIPNTKISTVLLQTDSDDYYLYRNIYGKYSRYGNPYVKSDCTMGKEGLSKNTIIYGHNTHDHLIFNRLEEYMKVDGYLNAPVITLDTLYETTKWKIFAVMLTNANSEDDNGYVFDYLYPTFESDNAFMAKMAQIQARSMIHTGVDVQPGDKTLMLYTCYRSIFDSGRLVIVARQLREGESEEIDKNQVYYDANAIFPAAYYTGGRAAATTAATATTAVTAAQSATERTTASYETTRTTERSYNDYTTAAPTEYRDYTPTQEDASAYRDTESENDYTPPDEPDYYNENDEEVN